MSSKKEKQEEITDLDILNYQENYKNYILNVITNFNIKILAMKITIAFIVSFIFDLFNLFIGYNFFISYILIEILYFNYIDKSKFRP